MKAPPIHTVLCNGANLPSKVKRQSNDVLTLEYRDIKGVTNNINLCLPDFVRGAGYLPNRIRDLLEIAAYVFAADRFLTRGQKDAVEYHSWSRAFHFFIKVRDFDFWSVPTTQSKLAKALCFISGDQSYKFTFQAGHSTEKTGLFDSEEFVLESGDPTSVILFSGGLDSLAGTLERLETSKDKICLVSHRSYSGTKRTQDQLVNALQQPYSGRVKHYKFELTLKGVRAKEETQRTRALLYGSIAFALSLALKQKSYFVYENGMTAINFPKRQDMMNARASRTAHPKTIALLQELFSEIAESQITILTPFLWKTKGEIFKQIAKYKRENLISSTVSCSKIFKEGGKVTQCGGCSQCIDRRFAAYSAELDDVDEVGIYDTDFIRKPIEDGEVRTLVNDYIYQASNFASWNADYFGEEMLNELVEVTDYVGEKSDITAIEKVWDLTYRHGNQVLKGIRRIREIHDNPFRKFPKDSLIELVNQRDYLKEPVQRLTESICDCLKRAIPVAFHSDLPANENDFNSHISALLQSRKEKFVKEHPAIRFALAHVVPDHSSQESDLWIESKYIRKATTPSKASDGIAADLTKYPKSCHILFIIYDPSRAISDDETFKNDFEAKEPGRCTVCVIR